MCIFIIIIPIQEYSKKQSIEGKIKGKHLGLLFLYLGVNTSKGSIPAIKTNVMFFLVGGTILGY